MTDACKIVDGDDGRGHAARAARRHDGRAGRGRRARDAAARLADAVVPHAPLLVRLRREPRLAGAERPRADRRGRGRHVRLRCGARVGLLVRLRPHDRLRRAAGALRRGLRRRCSPAQEAGRAAAVPGRDLQRPSTPPAASRSRMPARPVLPPPHGPRHRARRARAALHLGRGRHRARGRHDVHGRAVDPLGRALRRALRGRRRLRRGRRARAQRVPQGVRHHHHRRPEHARRIPRRAAREGDRAGLLVALRGLGRHDRRLRVRPRRHRSGPDGQGPAGRPLPGQPLGLPVQGAHHRRLRRPHRGDPRRPGVPRAARATA